MTTAKEKYDYCVMMLLIYRALEFMSDEDEDLLLDQMDPLWWKMSAEERSS